MQVLVNSRMLVGAEIVRGQALVLDGERIRGVVPEAEAPRSAHRVDLEGGLLAPGFIDLQVNGGGGALFNDAPHVETISTIGRAHRRFGTTGFLPTLISTDRERMEKAAEAVQAAIEAHVPGVLGLHFEGPHLNPARRGVHEIRHIRPLADGDLERLTALRKGRTLVTLAPESVPLEAIRTLHESDIVVSAGHTEATHERLKAALRAGVTGFTHLYNAMGPLGSREPGAVGTALAEDECWCGIIVDLVHVHPASVGVVWRAKPRGKLFLVTDAMPPVGAETTDFMLGEHRIEVEGGRCITADGRLAGSVLDMASAVRNAVRVVGIPLVEALRMASTYPAEFIRLGHERGRIAADAFADLVLLDEDLRVRATWIAGSAQWETPA